MWYGLIKDGELIDIQRFCHEPSIMDFRVNYFSWCDYEVVEIDPVIK